MSTMWLISGKFKIEKSFKRKQKNPKKQKPPPFPTHCAPPPPPHIKNKNNNTCLLKLRKRGKSAHWLTDFKRNLGRFYLPGSHKKSVYRWSWWSPQQIPAESSLWLQCCMSSFVGQRPPWKRVSMSSGDLLWQAVEKNWHITLTNFYQISIFI